MHSLFCIVDKVIPILACLAVQKTSIKTKNTLVCKGCLPFQTCADLLDLLDGIWMLRLVAGSSLSLLLTAPGLTSKLVWPKSLFSLGFSKHEMGIFRHGGKCWSKKGRLITYLNNVLELQVIFSRMMSRKKLCCHLTVSLGLTEQLSRKVQGIRSSNEFFLALKSEKDQPGTQESGHPNFISCIDSDM